MVDSYNLYTRTDEVGFGKKQETVLVEAGPRLQGFASCPADDSYFAVDLEDSQRMKLDMQEIKTIEISKDPAKSLVDKLMTLVPKDLPASSKEFVEPITELLECLSK